MIVASQMYTKLFRPWDVPTSENKNYEYGYKNIEQSKTTILHHSTVRESVLNSEKETENICNKKSCGDSKLKRSQMEKANKLRKIRNRMIHQDSTISTTTEDDIRENGRVSSNELRNLEEINKRLGCEDVSSESAKKSEKQIRSEVVSKHHISGSEEKYKDEIKGNISSTHVPRGFTPCYPEHLVSPMEVIPYSDLYSPTLPRFPGDLMTQADLAQSLGIPPTDPMLLESFAQGYAMELEYARILHEENQAKLLNAKKQRPKKYKCPHCDVGFSNNGQLKGHIRIHTGERPFKCDDKNCGKTFTRNEELTRHRRIHSGLRPYPCPTCGKKFGRRDHLKKHTKTHLAQAERMMPMFVPLSALPAQYPYLYGY